jgi:hypothetical protein
VIRAYVVKLFVMVDVDQNAKSWPMILSTNTIHACPMTLEKQQLEYRVDGIIKWGPSTLCFDFLIFLHVWLICFIIVLTCYNNSMHVIFIFKHGFNIL